MASATFVDLQRMGDRTVERWRVSDGAINSAALDITMQRMTRITGVDSQGVFSILSATPNVARIAAYPVLPTAMTAVQASVTALNDLTSNGASFTGTEIVTFTVVVADGTTNPDTYKWKKNSGSFSTPANITAGALTLSDGVTVTFGAVNGHTTNDTWIVTVYPAATYFDAVFYGIGG